MKDLIKDKMVAARSLRDWEEIAADIKKTFGPEWRRDSLGAFRYWLSLLQLGRFEEAEFVLEELATVGCSVYRELRDHRKNIDKVLGSRAGENVSIQALDVYGRAGNVGVFRHKKSGKQNRGHETGSVIVKHSIRPVEQYAYEMLAFSDLKTKGAIPYIISSFDMPLKITSIIMEDVRPEKPIKWRECSAFSLGVSAGLIPFIIDHRGELNGKPLQNYYLAKSEIWEICETIDRERQDAKIKNSSRREKEVACLEELFEWRESMPLLPAHNDLSPGNIIFGNTSSCGTDHKILDWGALRYNYLGSDLRGFLFEPGGGAPCHESEWFATLLKGYRESCEKNGVMVTERELLTVAALAQFAVIGSRLGTNVTQSDVRQIDDLRSLLVKCGSEVYVR